MSDKEKPIITIKINEEPNWFTEALERIDEGKEPFKKEK
jgi:hypothetical protein